MAGKPITIRWGADFRNALSLNDGVNYDANAHTLFTGPEIALLLHESPTDVPYLSRTTLKEKVFSIWFAPRAQPYSDNWHELRRAALKAMYNATNGTKSSPVRIHVEHGEYLGAPRKMYIEAICEQITPLENGRGGFEARFTAPDARFFREDGSVSTEGPVDLVGDGLNETYTDFLMPYEGTAPSEPIVTFQIGGLSGVYDYYQEWSFTNPSTRSLVNWPCVINLGDIRTNVDNAAAHGVAQGTIKFHEVNHAGGDHRIKDIRVETLSGLRKNVYIRDSGERGLPWHQYVKVWFIMASLGPGETKKVRVLYGNADAPVAEVYPDQSAIKMQIHGYESDNEQWYWNDFAPVRTEPQTRAMQWTPYTPPGSPNLMPIEGADDHFLLTAGGANVPCAGARVVNTAPVSGSTGMKIALALAIKSVTYGCLISTNSKTPLVVRWQHRDGSWTDGLGADGVHWESNSVWRTTLRANWVYTGVTADDRVVPVTSVGPGGSQGQFVVGQVVHIMRTDIPLRHRAIITGINVASSKGTPNIQIDTPPSGTSWYANTPGEVQAAYSFTRTFNWPTFSIDPPAVLAFILRGDVPTLNSGGWYYGGAEEVRVYFSDEEKLVVVQGPEVDLNNTKFQLRGKFGNPATDEWMRINFITHSIRDRVQIDCISREIYYIAWNSGEGSYEEPESIREALRFDEIRDNWIHLEPGLDNRIKFYNDPDSNFRDTDLYAEYNVRDY